jgi:hypothetical protein
VNDGECSPELSIVTRWSIGGSGGEDAEVPPKPVFGIGPGQRGGTVELSGVAFPDLGNTRSITAGTLILHYWGELDSAQPIALANGVGPQDEHLDLAEARVAFLGSYLQIGAEILRVDEVLNSHTRYRVTRGAHGSSPASHSAQSAIFHLASKAVVTSFPRDFFGSPYSGSWSYPVSLPDARVASAEFFVTNQLGNSEVASVYLTQTVDGGLRTLSGGQYSIQVNGFLAVDQSAAPALVVERSHSVRDVFAVLGAAADSGVQLVVKADGADYCTLTVPAGANVSNSVDGNSLPPLTAGARVSLSVISVGATYPGADLTVIIRL